MAIETKIKEVNAVDKLPAIYSSENRAKIIYVTRLLGSKLEGVCMHPKESFGQYSVTWSAEEFSRMGKGSELTIKFIQE
ncbi:hypothetical protein LPB90_18395 [Chryseobacterium sp. LC2016-29]|uniref:hypothetical protein n=1 Tax=Chryseobacterium sp. LC2016-29 TaxID=2897331 RepID=UPI001E338A54|nr:hypothetical protein [Chryseobacterium sp. LC2016-29]MCD0480413.1 hypothetical protein [Chryseobacterium sp. LC2016-29]